MATKNETNMAPEIRRQQEANSSLHVFSTRRVSKTKFTLRHAGIPAGQMSDMTTAGWNESLDKLADSLK